MLSYQHQYHAANAADVHKHALLCTMLDRLAQKPKPLSYIETHAGRGLYDLASPEALRTGEARAGAGALEARFDPAHPWRRRLRETRARFGAQAYPGSPLLAAMSLRAGDSLHLCELHPREHAALVRTMLPWGAHVHRADGFAQAFALTPPTPRRGLMLIDPSWEVKEDYRAVPRHIAGLARKWNVGVMALWYPVLPDARHAPMLRDLGAAFPDALRHEVSVAQAVPGRGMQGSGMFVVNPPFGLAEEAARLTAIFEAAG